MNKVRKVKAIKELFLEYYSPSEEEFNWMWGDGEFVLDTNVLLSLYRYTEPTTNELINILGKVKKQLWLPHQAALEFYRNRVGVIYEQSLNYDVICTLIENESETLITKIKKVFPRHPYIDNIQIATQLKQAINKTIADIKKSKEKHPKWLKDDSILKKIEELYEGKIGQEYSDDILRSIYDEGESRYYKETPPGYMDVKKDDSDKTLTRKYGDLVMWNQILDHAKETKKPVLFITDEKKEDWWQIVRGETIGPRPELIKEIHEKSGVSFHMYSVEQFIRYAENNFGIQINEEAIQEVENAKKDISIQMSDVVSSEDVVSSSLQKGLTYEIDTSEISKGDLFQNQDENIVGEKPQIVKKNKKDKNKV